MEIRPLSVREPTALRDPRRHYRLRTQCDLSETGLKAVIEEFDERDDVPLFLHVGAANFFVALELVFGGEINVVVETYMSPDSWCLSSYEAVLWGWHEPWEPQILRPSVEIDE